MKKINRVYLYLLFMELLVASDTDDAAKRMAARIAQGMEGDAADANDEKISGFWRSVHYDMITIPTPAISADWLEESEVVRAGGYDGYVFLSRHSAESGVLALTCHSTGNFGEAAFGGNDYEVAIPHPHLQKAYMKRLYEKKAGGSEPRFSNFDVTIEATHHGPSALCKPSIFIEVGTTPAQWTDSDLCTSVADTVHETLTSDIPSEGSVAICFGGTHYPSKFTDELLKGTRALGTVVPKRAIHTLDDKMFEHILHRNAVATEALLDWGGLQSADKKKIDDMLSTTDLRVSRI